jgi:hypothetical protein
VGIGIGFGIAVPAALSFRCMASRSIDYDRNIYGGGVSMYSTWAMGIRS